MKRAYRLQDAIQNPMVEYLFLNHQGLKEIPKAIFKLKNLRKLDLGHNQIKQLSDELIFLQNLEDLILSHNQISHFPEGIRLASLKKLDISHNRLEFCPDLHAPSLIELNLANNQLEDIPIIPSLKKLDASSNLLKKLPNTVQRLKALTDLNLKNNPITRLPKNIGTWQKLEKLEMGNNRLSKVPEGIGELKNLRILRLNKNRLKNLPKSIGQCKMLRILELDFNKIAHLPPSLGQLQWLAYLSIRKNKLERLATTVTDCTQLKELDVSQNQLKNLPKNSVSWNNLFRLNLTDNQFKTLPILPKSLSQLLLNRNRFEQFPKTILALNRLQVLELSSNTISSLPPQIVQLQQLKAFNLTNNPIVATGEYLLQLPNLETLYGVFDKVQKRYFKQIRDYGMQQKLQVGERFTLFQLLQNPEQSAQPSLKLIFHLLNLGSATATRIGRSFLFQEQSLQLPKQTHITVLGQLHVPMTRLRQQLEELEISISRKTKEGQALSVLVGQNPKNFQSFLSEEVHFFSEQTLYRFIQKNTNAYLLNNPEEETIERIVQMLLHADERNVQMGLELIKNGGVHRSFITPLAVVYFKHANAKIRKECWNLLYLNLEDDIIALLQYPKRFWERSQQKKKQYLKQLARTGKFDLKFLEKALG